MRIRYGTLTALLLTTLAGCEAESTPPVPPAEGPAPAPATEGRATERPVAGEAPPVTLTVASHEEFLAELGRHRGDVVLLDCWATWCPPCRAGFPHSVALAEEHGDRGLTVISVAFDEPDDADAVREFLDQSDAGGLVNLVSATGASSEAFEQYDVTGGALPHLKVYGRDGTVAATFGGTGKKSPPEEVAAAVEAALKTTPDAG